MAFLPLLTLTVAGRKLQNALGSNWFEVFTMTSAYLALFGSLTLLTAVGYFLKVKNGGQTSIVKSRIQLAFTVTAMAFFITGALLLPTIGQRMMGGFVALSLLSMLAALSVFVANLLTRKGNDMED
ncbi:MAG: hypothetical protein IT269_07015 [Saprospiraceae bacterium]|nr:hypothetical protein [Saprospiraceae bacterium]